MSVNPSVVSAGGKEEVQRGRGGEREGGVSSPNA